MSIRLWRWLVNDQTVRKRWEASLAWFRLRYLDASGPARCIHLLSSARSCGRVALYYLPDAAVSRLYIGVPAEDHELLRRMSADLKFSIREIPDLQPPPAMPLAPADQLPWDRDFYAHVVEGHLFVAMHDELAGKRSYLPSAPGEQETLGNWSLPPLPPVGLSMQPSWNGYVMRSKIPTPSADASFWPLGWSHDETPMFAGCRVNLYGGQEAVAGWLAHLVEHLLREGADSLVVIDGSGDLVPMLKRKSAVTRLLGRQLTYIDIDSAVVTGGFNPLAPVPGESDVQTLQRWQQWFSGMGVHQEGVQLLAQAMEDGVTDIATLQRWLQRPAQQHFAAAVSNLQTALRRLQADPLLREWLSWPTNVFGGLPEGALLLACRSTGWGRQQLLVSAVRAALALAETRFVLHGFPWAATTIVRADFAGAKQLFLSNGPLLNGSTVVLTNSERVAASKLAQRFLSGDALSEENLQLLRQGEGMIVRGPAITVASWRNGT